MITLFHSPFFQYSIIPTVPCETTPLFSSVAYPAKINTYINIQAHLLLALF